MIEADGAIVVLCSSATVPVGRDGVERSCGVWAEELVRPWSVFLRSGYSVVIATPDGHPVTIEPSSLGRDSSLLTAAGLSEVIEFLKEKKTSLVSPFDLRDLLGNHRFLGVFIPGGYGPTAQFDSDDAVRSFMLEFLSKNVPIAAVCHGVSALLNVDAKSFSLAGRNVTSFSNAEERCAGADSWVPYLLESRLEERGLDYSAAEPWSCHVIEDASLITGQNPASSEEAAIRLIRCIEQRDLA